LEGEGYGIETSVTLRPFDHWRLVAGYTWARLQLREKPGGTSSFLEAVGVGIGNPGISMALPEHIFSLRSLVNLPFNFEFDGTYYYVDDVPLMQVPAYSRLDLRLGWRPIDMVELSFTAQNITNAVHQEWNYEFEYTHTLIPRSYHAEVTLRF
jgi:iron complex outermembrane receptor protein